MSIFASILRAVYRLSGVKKSFTLPENELRKKIEKQNRHRGVFYADRPQGILRDGCCTLRKQQAHLL